ncbi:MAG TPA: hypothetical protein VFK38_06005 [Candidatus Limnocylindrales bacterium]|nr:hypothetical protein [Candidatus Limnocylindrales bacterium]
MAGLTWKSLDQPEAVMDFEHGRSLGVQVGESELWRSELRPGWSWDEDIKPYAEGATSCPMVHREYVISGRIRYLMDDGTEHVAGPGEHLVIEPGHRAWVVGDEPCVMLDW